MDESSKRWANNTERERDKLIPTRDVYFNNHNSLHHHVLRQACLVVESYLVPSIACKFLLRFPRSSRLVEETTSLDFCILLCLRCGIIVLLQHTLSMFLEWSGSKCFGISYHHLSQRQIANQHHAKGFVKEKKHVWRFADRTCGSDFANNLQCIHYY